MSSTTESNTRNPLHNLYPRDVSERLFVVAVTGWVQVPDIEDNYVDLFCTVSEEDIIFWETDTMLTHTDPVLVLKLGELTGIVRTADRNDLLIDPNLLDEFGQIAERPPGVDEEGVIIKSVIKLITEYATWRIKFNPKYPEVCKIWWKELIGGRKHVMETDGADTVYARHFNRRLFPRNGQADIPGDMPIWKKVEGMALATKDSSGTALKSSSISILRGTDTMAGKLFVGSAAASKLLMKGSLQATKATAKGTLAGGYLLAKATVDKSVLYAPSMMSASVEGARQARKLIKITGQGGEAATMATLQLAGMGAENVLKGTGFLLKKTLKSAAAVTIMSVHATEEAAKASLAVANAATEASLAVAGAGMGVASAGVGMGGDSKLGRDLAKQRKKAAQAAEDAGDLQDMQNRVITREFEDQIGAENLVMLDSHAASEQAAAEAAEVSGWNLQQKRDRLAAIKKFGKKDRIGNLLPIFTEVELGALTKQEARVLKKAQLLQKKEMRENAELAAEVAAAELAANPEEFSSGPLAAVVDDIGAPPAAPAGPTEAELAAMTPKQRKKAELAAKKAALEQKKADRLAGKGAKNGKKGKKGAVGPAEAVPEGAPPEEEAPAPLAATEDMLNKYGALPDPAEAVEAEPAAPMTEKEKKKAALAKKKADLEAKKAARKKGGSKAAPMGPAAPGLAAGDVAAAEMAMEAAAQAAAAPADAPAVAPVGPTEAELAAMTPKEKKKAELAAKKAALEQKKLDRAAGKGKKGKKGAIAPAEAAAPVALDADPQQLSIDIPEADYPAATSTDEAAGAVVEPAVPMTPKEKKKAELAAKKAALEQKKLDRASVKKGGKTGKKTDAGAAAQAQADAIAEAVAQRQQATAAANAAREELEAARAEMMDMDVEAPEAPAGPTEEELAAMTPKERKKAELAVKKAALEQKKLDRANKGKNAKKNDTGAAQARLTAAAEAAAAADAAQAAADAAEAAAKIGATANDGTVLPVFGEGADAIDMSAPHIQAMPETDKERKKRELAAKKVRHYFQVFSVSLAAIDWPAFCIGFCAGCFGREEGCEEEGRQEG